MIRALYYVACDCCQYAAQPEDTEQEARKRAAYEGFTTTYIHRRAASVCRRCAAPEHDKALCIEPVDLVDVVS